MGPTRTRFPAASAVLVDAVVETEETMAPSAPNVNTMPLKQAMATIATPQALVMIIHSSGPFLAG